MYFKTVPINSTHVIIVTLTVSRAADACSRGVMVPMRPNATDSDPVTAPQPQENRHDRAGPSEPGLGRLARGPAGEAGVAASNSASAAANTAAIGTRPYLRAQFDELAEMPISILRMGSGVCTHSRRRAPLNFKL